MECELLLTAITTPDVSLVFFFFCFLFSIYLFRVYITTLSVSLCAVLLMNGELERTWKEMIVAYFKILSYIRGLREL